MQLMILSFWMLGFSILAFGQQETVNFISSVLRMQAKAAPQSTVSSYLCWPYEREIWLVQQLSKEGFMISSVSSVNQMIKQFTSYNSHHYTTFLLNLTCPGAKLILLEATHSKKFSPRDRWLLIRDDTCQDFELFLEGLDISLESDVLLATKQSSEVYMVNEIYKRNNTTLVRKRITYWNHNDGLVSQHYLIPSVRRMDLHKSVLKGTIVLFSKGRLEDLMLSKDEQTPTKVDYSLYHIVLDILNASEAVFIQDSHGYKVNGTWSGQMGYLHRGEADLGISSMIPQQERIVSAVYVAEIIDTGVGFYFRQPPLSFVQNIFTLPFSKSLWLAFSGLVLLIVVFLYLVLLWEFVQNLSPKQTWSDVVLLALGAVCQQASMVQSNGITGRSVILLLLMMVMFLYTSYSANIVALLPAMSNSIQTLEDLYHSGFTIAALDVKYNHHFFSTASDPLRRNIFTQKVSPSRGRKHFYNIKEGLNKIKEGKFAFHMDLASADVAIMDTYKEEEKCGLTIVHFLTEASRLYACVSRKSPYKEIITIAYRKIDEYGLKHRFRSKFLMKPKCAGEDSTFVSVGIMECYPAILVLVYGMLCSLGVLVIEIVAKKRKSALRMRHRLPFLHNLINFHR